MKTVLIHAYECAPYHRPGSTIGAQRPKQFAKYLPVFGWRTVVLCSDFSNRYHLNPKSDWKKVINELVSEKVNQWEGEGEERGLILPLPSLTHGSLLDKFWLHTVQIIPEEGVFAPKKGILLSILRKILSFLKFFWGDHSQSWQKVAVQATKQLLNNGIRPDIQIAEHGPDAGLYVSQKIYQKFQIPWVVDCRDPLLMGFPPNVQILLKLYCKYFLLRSAEALINVNPAWVMKEGERFGKAAYLVTNGYDQEEFEDIHSLEMGSSARIKILYYGNFYPFQDMEGFLKELGDCCKKSISLKNKIIFEYYGSAYRKLEGWAEECGLTNQIISHPFIVRKHLLERAKSADLLLLLSVAPYKSNIPPDFSHGFYPGKVFEYFGLRTPILCYPGDKGELSNLLAESKSGYIVDKGQLYDFLLQFKQGNNSLIQNMSWYSRKNQSRILADLLFKLSKT